MQLAWRQGAFAVSAFLLTASAVDAALAQPATPAVYPVAPDPAECVVAPPSMEEIEAIMTTPVAQPAGTPAQFVTPMGEPADAETAAEVVATLHQVFACANAGDVPRITSLYTDDFVREFLAGVPLEDLLGFLAMPPQPFPEEQKRIIIRFGEVQLLADGRAGVVIVLDEPADPRTEEPDYAILERVEGRWLVDELHEDGGVVATPASATPAA